MKTQGLCLAESKAGDISPWHRLASIQEYGTYNLGTLLKERQIKDSRQKNKVPGKGPAMPMMDDFQQRKHQHLTNGQKDALKTTRIKNVLISTEASINELKQQSQKFSLNKENFYNQQNKQPREVMKPGTMKVLKAK